MQLTCLGSVISFANREVGSWRKGVVCRERYPWAEKALGNLAYFSLQHATDDRSEGGGNTGRVVTSCIFIKLSKNDPDCCLLTSI